MDCSRNTPSRKRSDVSQSHKVNMKLVETVIPKFKQYMMTLWRTDMTYKILEDSGIGKTLKFFQDYCKAYEEDLTELRTLINMSEKILEKWKNFVMNYVFDYKLEPQKKIEQFEKDNKSEFIKYD